VPENKRFVQASSGSPVPRFFKQSTPESWDFGFNIPAPPRGAWSSSSDDLLLEFLHGSQRDNSAEKSRR